MAINFQGFGAFCIRRPGALGLGGLDVVRVAEVNIAQEVTTETAQAYPSDTTGILQDTDTVSTVSTWTVTTQHQSLDTGDIDLIFNQKMGTAASVTYPVYKTGTIPASPGPYTITETGLTADQVVEATILASTSPGNVKLTQIANAGSPTTGQFEVTSNTLTFHADQAGLAVGYFYKTTASLSYRGGANAIAELGELELFFRYKFGRSATRYLWFPRIQKEGGVTFGSGVDQIEMAYRALLPSGWNLPYMEWTA